MLEIRPNSHQRSKATAWDGPVHVADLYRERDARRAKPLDYPLPLMTSAELRAHAETVLAIAEALDAWMS